MLHSDPAYAAAVAELRAMDGLCDADWPEVDEDGVGFGRAQFMQQDGGGALLDGQLLSSDIEDMKKCLESPELEEAKKVVSAAPHYDNSRTHHEFKGFFLEDA